MGNRILSGIGGLAVVVAAWWVLSLTLGPALIPPPPRVATVLVGLLLRGELLLHAGASLLRLVAGITVATAIAIPIGIAAGVSRRIDRFVSPVVYVLYPIPKIAFLPVFMVLFGLGDLSKILLLISVIVFQLVLAARDGVRGIPRELLFAADTLRLGRRERIARLYLPSTLPQLFSAVRISVGIGIAVLFLAENYATSYGMGYFIMNNWVMINYPRMFAGIVALGLIAAGVLTTIDLLQRLLCPWLTPDR
ncbi:MAG: ABC transporter permease subunit [Spirochaeta sp.]|nr:ABC transporter permease subunit [Spirochaeta sp.]